jgi:hypothetical protein
MTKLSPAYPISSDAEDARIARFEIQGGKRGKRAQTGETRNLLTPCKELSWLYESYRPLWCGSVDSHSERCRKQEIRCSGGCESACRRPRNSRYCTGGPDVYGSVLSLVCIGRIVLTLRLGVFMVCNVVSFASPRDIRCGSGKEQPSRAAISSRVRIQRPRSKESGQGHGSSHDKLPWHGCEGEFLHPDGFLRHQEGRDQGRFMRLRILTEPFRRAKRP